MKRRRYISDTEFQRLVRLARAEGLGELASVRFGPDGSLELVDAGGRRMASSSDGDADDAEKALARWEDAHAPARSS